jgi:hypothetical protein
MPINSPKDIGIEGKLGSVKRQKIVRPPVADQDCLPITENGKGIALDTDGVEDAATTIAVKLRA